MDQIPEEVIINVFSYLKQRDRKSARQACKRWRRISYAYSLIKRDVLVVHNYQELVSTCTPNSAFNEDFNIVNILLSVGKDDIQGPADVMLGNAFWRYFGVNFRTIVVHISSTHFEVLLDILLCCPNLERLVVSTDCTFYPKSLRFSFFNQVRLEKLTHFTLKGNRQLCLPLLKATILNAPLLKYIKFVCGTGWCRNSFGNLHKPLGSNWHIEKATHLTSMDIQCGSVDNRFIELITDRVGFQLKILTIAYSVKLTTWALKVIEEKCKNLEQIKIGQWNFDTEYFKNFFSTLKKLTVVSIFWSNSIDNDAVSSLRVLTCLTHLSIADCKKVTDDAIQKIFDEAKPKMIELRLIKLRITDNLIKKIIPNLKNLQMLNLSYCRSVTTDAIESVAEHVPSLLCLSINGCVGIDIAIARQFQGILPPYFNTLNNLAHFGAMEMLYLSRACNSSLQLPRLKVLDLTTLLPDSFDLVHLCPSLEVINNLTLNRMEDSMPNYAADMTLRRLNLLKCYNSPLGPCYSVRRILLNIFS